MYHFDKDLEFGCVSAWLRASCWPGGGQNLEYLSLRRHVDIVTKDTEELVTHDASSSFQQQATRNPTSASWHSSFYCREGNQWPRNWKHTVNILSACNGCHHELLCVNTG